VLEGIDLVVEDLSEEIIVFLLPLLLQTPSLLPIFHSMRRRETSKTTSADAEESLKCESPRIVTLEDPEDLHMSSLKVTGLSLKL